MGKVLLFYLYCPIENPSELRESQERLCRSLELTGRIIVATEGINGTLGGSTMAIQAYVDAMHTDQRFATIDFKISPGGSACFPRLSVKIKQEIVRLGIDPSVIRYQDAGTALSPQQFHEKITQRDEKTIILDSRNTYETRVGKFTDAITPPIQTFKEFPTYVDTQIDGWRDKTVLMYCTGGVRCERASAYLKAKGVSDVYQLKGGIHRYLEQFPDGHFRGINYVFDARFGERTNADILGTCNHCQVACDFYTNCKNASCNKHFICCERCIEMHDNTCSTHCLELLNTGAVQPRPPLQRTTVNHRHANTHENSDNHST